MMGIAELVGKVQTVLGPIAPEDLGITMMHEHLFIAGAPRFAEPEEVTDKKLAHQPVSQENRWWVCYNRMSNLDELTLDDEELAIKEVSYYQRAGGGSIVDCSNYCLSRDPLALTHVARATGLNVIMGAGYYLGRTFPADAESKTEEEMSEEIVLDITVGAGNTGIRPGIIGEVGTSWPLDDREKKSLRASARAQKITGAPITVHTGHPVASSIGPLEIIDVLSKAGADISHVIMSHIDVALRNPEDRYKLAETGCYIQYDEFGVEGWFPRKFGPDGLVTIDLPNDYMRVNEIMDLISRGYLNQIMVSHDVCHKSYLRSYGGYGYDHILRNVVPLMHDKGMSDEQINALLVENPRRALQFV